MTNATTSITVELYCDDCSTHIAEASDSDAFSGTYSEDSLLDQCYESDDVYYHEGSGAYLCESCYDNARDDDEDGRYNEDRLNDNIDQAQVQFSF